MVEELIKKITSYNLFNNLLPGVVFSFFVGQFTSFDFLSNDWLINLFLFYFYGSIIGRLGSLCVEPVVKYFVPFAKYKDYLHAAKKDKLITELNETNNFFRSMVATFCSLGILIVIDHTVLSLKINLNSLAACLVISTLLIVLFVSSYIKQIKYIKQRVAKAIEKDGEK